MIDLKMDMDTNDLAIDNFDLSLVDGLNQIRQKLKIRLQFFYGEWYLDTTKGVKYYEEILIKNPLLEKVSSILKTTILETPGVNDLLSFDMSYSVNRQLSVSFSVDTVSGILTMNEVLI